MTDDHAGVAVLLLVVTGLGFVAFYWLIRFVHWAWVG